jgi:L-glyceraldehyde 3-phosphate reductase
MHTAHPDRYDRMSYRRCGRSGLRLPTVSLGLWQRFGGDTPLESVRERLRTAFDLGITHFDLANNYGPPAGSAEEQFGIVMSRDLAPYRDELVISTKAGYHMWPGPYGEWGSRKYLLGSLEASLRRMRLDHVDIFYSHRYDPDTPLEETMGALASAVQRGLATYVGVSSYSATKTREAERILREMGVPLLIHQPSYSMLNRWIEADLLDTVADLGVGVIAFSPLAQGLLTDKYLRGVPEGARAAHADSFRDDFLRPELLDKVRSLAGIATDRGQSLAQMALAWCLRDERITSVLIGASSSDQIVENVAALDRLAFADDEIEAIDRYATESGINIWAQSHQAG